MSEGKVPDIAFTPLGHLAAGQASFMALEALMLALSYKGILTPADLIDAIEITVEAKQGLHEDGEAPEVVAIATGMLKKMANSLAASANYARMGEET